MAIFSQNLLFSDDQAVTTTAVSDSTIDFKAKSTIPLTGTTQDRDMGAGTKIPVGIHVTTAFAGGTSLAVQLLQSDTIDGNGDLTSSEVVATTPAIVTASLVAGYRFNMDVLPTKVTKRYIQLKYVVVGTMTAGKVMAGITAGNDEAN